MKPRLRSPMHRGPAYEGRRAAFPIPRALAVLALLYAGCDLSGTPRSQLQNVGSCAQELNCFDQRGDYRPYFQTGDLGTPRYLYAGAVTASGTVFVVGGSDERGLSALDTVEFFDQCAVEKDTLPPESGAGLWIDTNFEGDPITLDGGPRLFHTVTALGSSNVFVVIGGTTNILAGGVYEKAEIYDPTTRTFRSTEADMLTPRFRHTTLQLGGGGLLIVGGQFQTTTTEINEDIPEGFPGRETQVTVFPSTPAVEIFNPSDEVFIQPVVANTNLITELLTPRGRADHAMGRIAGPDNRLNTGDDLFIVAGGFQTLSALTGQAPRTKLPGAIGRQEASGITDIEVFDPGNMVFRINTSVSLDSPRMNGVQVVNLGLSNTGALINDFTPDGVEGMGNAILITHGNTDATCPTTPLFDQLLIANFAPNAGPLEGLRFFQVEEQAFFSHVQNAEYLAGLQPVRGDQVARAAINTVTLPRPIQSVAGVPGVASWVFSLAGVDIFPTPGGCVYNYDSPAMLSGCVFDPFFSLRAVFQNNLSPRDLSAERRSEPLNFLGIVGVWFTLDGLITDDMSGWATTPEQNRWAQHKGVRRVFCRAFPLPGPDGALNTSDDRILLAGGGQDYQLQGGEPTSPPAEIFVPPPACAEER